jgi:hypothetical protein
VSEDAFDFVKALLHVARSIGVERAIDILEAERRKTRRELSGSGFVRPPLRLVPAPEPIRE